MNRREPSTAASDSVTEASRPDDASIARFRSPGWPRPYALYRAPIGRLMTAHNRSRRMPGMYLLGSEPLYNRWVAFDEQAEERCTREGLCATCGEALGSAVAMGRIGEVGDRTTSGPGSHPRCLLLAVSFCPHLLLYVERGEPALWLHTREGVPSRSYLSRPGDYDRFDEVSRSAQPMTARELRAWVRENHAQARGEFATTAGHGT